MSKEMAVIAAGIWVLIVPYLGVPGSWRTTLLIITGVALIVLGFFLRAEAIARAGRRGHSSFVEHVPNSTHERTYERKEGISSLN